MSKTKRLGLDEIELEYRSLVDDLNDFRHEISRTLDSVLKEGDVKLGFPIQSRVKGLESIKNKQESKIVKIVKSITELQDLVGLRIILLSNRDIDKVISLFKDNLKVVKQLDTTERLEENQFGYSSIHLVAELNDSWYQVPTFRNCEGFKVEIQIRTLSQHNWAELSRLIDYKSGNEYPKEFRRSISRVSALLETVDLEFERLLQNKEDFEAKQRQKSQSKLLTTENLQNLLELAVPERFHHGNENYEMVVNKLHENQYTTTNQIQMVIDNFLSQAIIKDEKICKALKNPDLVTVLSDGSSSVEYNGMSYVTTRKAEILKGGSYGNATSLLGNAIGLSKENVINSAK